MYWAIKFIQSLVKALNSEGTPGQIAAGIALGACFGLTPLIFRWLGLLATCKDRSLDQALSAQLQR